MKKKEIRNFRRRLSQQKAEMEKGYKRINHESYNHRGDIHSYRRIPHKSLTMNREINKIEAIKIARENGWRQPDPCEDYHTATALLDPLFWQALGRGMGWKNEFPSIRRCALSREGVKELKAKGYLKDVTTGRIIGESRDGKLWNVRWDGKKYTQAIHKDFIYEFPTDWRMYWHRFIDCLAEGKTTDYFFQTIP